MELTIVTAYFDIGREVLRDMNVEIVNILIILDFGLE